MYLDEVPEGQTRDDLALLIEEMLKQRIQGLQNEKGIWITPAFPKLIYALDEDNIYEDSKYYYLTKLAAKCTAKRMVPDYVSVKKMKELKGDVYPPMGCVHKNEVITYKYNNELFVESFERMWNRISSDFSIKVQPCGGDHYYIDTSNLTIWDTKLNNFTNVKRVIKNGNSKFIRVSFNNGRVITVTPDHPFETENRGVVYARDLKIGEDIIRFSNHQYCENDTESISLSHAHMIGGILSNKIDIYDVIKLLIDDNETELICNIFNSFYKKNFDKNIEEIMCDKTTDVNKFINDFFGHKIDRFIPSYVFKWSDKARAYFIRGMLPSIDGFSYIKYMDNTNDFLLNFDLTDKEFAIQLALLLQTFNTTANIYINRDSTYRVECEISYDFIKLMGYGENVCPNNSFFRKIIEKFSKKKNDNFGFVQKIEELPGLGISYDVTTESEHFEVSGIYSHNCRSFLTPDRSYVKGNIAKAKNFKEGERKYYGRFNQGQLITRL